MRNTFEIFATIDCTVNTQIHHSLTTYFFDSFAGITRQICLYFTNLRGAFNAYLFTEFSGEMPRQLLYLKHAHL